MKRFAAIVTIAVVLLTMSVGTAFASVCAAASSSCDDVAMVCPVSTSAACPMDSGQAMRHSPCGHSADKIARDSVAPQAGHQDAVVSIALAVVPTPPAPCGFIAASAAPDARGAPHLTAVIRI